MLLQKTKQCVATRDRSLPDLGLDFLDLYCCEGPPRESHGGILLFPVDRILNHARGSSYNFWMGLLYDLRIVMEKSGQRSLLHLLTCFELLDIRPRPACADACHFWPAL